MNPSYDFQGQVAIVTGASSGMGLATAEAFAQAGAAVVLADVNETVLRDATDDLTAAGRQAIGVACDVSAEREVAALVERAVSEFGRLDLAFNNAGIQAPPTDAADEPAELFDRVNAVNLRGVWACMKHELDRCARKAAARSSTTPRSAGSSDSLDVLPTTHRSTASSGSPRARRWSTRRGASAQRDLPGDDRDPDGRRDDRQGRARHGRGHRQPADRTPRPGGRDGGSCALAL
jgi:NAD(P)-dependent dehydrogenase (short-subunit alcohol dehydrogenase family)